jgi:hypothetical protein
VTLGAGEKAGYEEAETPAARAMTAIANCILFDLCDYYGKSGRDSIVEDV